MASSRLDVASAARNMQRGVFNSVLLVDRSVTLEQRLRNLQKPEACGDVQSRMIMLGPIWIRS